MTRVMSAFMFSAAFAPSRLVSSWLGDAPSMPAARLVMTESAATLSPKRLARIVSGAVDGYIGNRTRSAIRDFLKLKGLPADTSDADLIDYLEQAAEERGRSVGFTLCNRTKNRVWSAIARRSTEGWESRGWWRIEAGGCARVIDRPLRGSEHFVYAEMEEPTGLRTLSRASEAFCVGRAKFAISGRDKCEEGSYRTALFARTPAPTERKLVYEFFERDFAQANPDDE